MKIKVITIQGNLNLFTRKAHGIAAEPTKLQIIPKLKAEDIVNVPSPFDQLIINYL